MEELDSTQRDSRVGVARGRSCAIVGLPNAGKTTLLATLQQACLVATGDHYDLDFIPVNENTLALVRQASDLVFGGVTIPATKSVTDYEFQVVVEDRNSRGKPFFCDMLVTDGPGEHLLPSESSAGSYSGEAQTSLTDRIRESKSLVLCVDASDPAIDVLYRRLPELLLRLKERSERYIPQQRALLLLTKFDRLIDAVPTSWDNSSEAADKAAIVKWLSPVGQARAQLGAIVSMLSSALRPDDTLAVGLCSAVGFGGELHSPSKRVSARMMRTRTAERLRAWQPFGVREALVFLTTDVACSPVEKVDRASFRDSLRFMDVPLENLI